MIHSKELGQVYTPEHIVDMMLDEVGFDGRNIVTATVWEPSFGTGNFLVPIVKRIINQCREYGFTNGAIADMLSDHIYGNEIDHDAFTETLSRLNRLTLGFGLGFINWKHLCTNSSLEEDVHPYESFDYIIGNPPYVRCHNMDDATKDALPRFQYACGTTDAYILFFELCISRLSDNGRLIFISPNSYLKNTSQKPFRNFLLENNLIEKIIDFKQTQVFDDALVYTAITILRKSRKDTSFKYVDFSGFEDNGSVVVNINGDIKNRRTWCFSNSADEAFLSANRALPNKLRDICNVLNGVSTNKDSVYVASTIKKTEDQLVVEFNGHLVEKSIIRNALKASSLENKYILFPYRWSEQEHRYVAIDEETLRDEYPLAYQYLLCNRTHLETRDMECGAAWYEYARSQGLRNNSSKIAFKNIVSTDASKPIAFSDAPADTIVYSGLFVTIPDASNESLIKSILSSREFKRYCVLCGKDMHGGYVSINSKTILEYGYVPNHIKSKSA